LSYAGDVSAKQAYELLSGNEDAQLIDVRTVPEWNFVGVTVLDDIGKKSILVDWQRFPTMEINTEFVEAVAMQLESLAVGNDAPLLCLCRSGVRSVAAAQALTAAGFTNAYNILEGFEGDKNVEQQRGTLGGWKVAGLPWAQG